MYIYIYIYIYIYVCVCVCVCNREYIYKYRDKSLHTFNICGVPLLCMVTGIAIGCNIHA
jgi:hypothetical protein